MSTVAFSSHLRSHFFKYLSSSSSSFSVFRRRIRRCSFVPPSRFSLLSPQFSKSPSSAQWSWRFNSNPVGVGVGVSSSPFSTSSHSQLHPPAPPTSSLSSPYLSVRIFCPKDVVDSLSEALLCFGASSTSIDEQEANHEADHHEVCMNSIFSIHQDVRDCISQAADSISLKEMPSYEVEMRDHTDWIQKTQDSFHPVEVTEGLWIVPEWRTPPDPQATNIVLNPGLAFGTGEHPTTKLCLVLLHGLIKGGEHFLDYGTGSGILAIAAIKFGATLSVAVDIDPQAITSAQHNAALNNIGPGKLQVLLVSGNGSPVLTDQNPSEKEQNPCNKENITGTDKYDVVIANILLNPLLDLADQIISYAKPGAVVGVSGILSEQVPCIMERYSQFLEGITVSKMDDWACVCGSKKMILTGG